MRSREFDILPSGLHQNSSAPALGAALWHLYLVLDARRGRTDGQLKLEGSGNKTSGAIRATRAVQTGRTRPGLDRLVTEQEQESALLPRACPRTQSAHVPG